MWLFRDKSNTSFWRAGWRDLHGKTHTRSTKTADKRLAHQRGLAFEREWDAAPSGPAYSLHQALKALKAHKIRSKRSPATLEITECKSGHLLRVFGRGRDVATLTLKDTEGYLDKRRLEGAHDHTVHKELGTLTQALRVARTHGHYLGEPKALWPPALRDVYEPGEVFLTVDQFKRAMVGMIVSRRDHFTVYCFTGVRHSELYRIEAKHLDRDGRRVFVDGTKTKQSRRWVNLMPEAQEVLERRADKHRTGPLFPDRWERGRMHNDLKRIAKRTQTPSCSANDLRRTFATWCGEAGVDEPVVIAWMGHRTSAMVRRVYQQLSQVRGRAQIERLTAHFEASKTRSRGRSKQGADKVHGGTGNAAETPEN